MSHVVKGKSCFVKFLFQFYTHTRHINGSIEETCSLFLHCALQSSKFLKTIALNHPSEPHWSELCREGALGGDLRVGFLYCLENEPSHYLNPSVCFSLHAKFGHFGDNWFNNCFLFWNYLFTHVWVGSCDQYVMLLLGSLRGRGWRQGYPERSWPWPSSAGGPAGGATVLRSFIFCVFLTCWYTLRQVPASHFSFS